MSKDKENQPIDFWNYRVFKNYTEQGFVWFNIRHCYYSNENKDIPHSYSGESMVLSGISEKDLKGTFELAAEALKKPSLYFDEFDLRPRKPKK